MREKQNNMKKNENSHFIDKLVDALRKAAVEMEEFQLKVALGKAEAEDNYEDIKKKFKTFVNDSKHKINVGKEKVEKLHMKFDKLMVQLNLGKAETLAAFKTQKKEILITIHEIVVEIKSNPTLNKIYAFVLIEFEKFKTQLDVLEEKLETGKDNFNSSFGKGKEEFNKYIQELKQKYAQKKEETRWEHFQNEIGEAFAHFKQAFAKPHI